MVQPNQNINQPPNVKPTDVKTWLTPESMSPMGRELMEIAADIDSSNELPMDEDAIEREVRRRRGGVSGDDE